MAKCSWGNHRGLDDCSGDVGKGEYCLMASMAWAMGLGKETWEDGLEGVGRSTDANRCTLGGKVGSGKADNSETFCSVNWGAGVLVLLASVPVLSMVMPEMLFGCDPITSMTDSVGTEEEASTGIAGSVDGGDRGQIGSCGLGLDLDESRLEKDGRGGRWEEEIVDVASAFCMARMRSCMRDMDLASIPVAVVDVLL